MNDIPDFLNNLLQKQFGEKIVNEVIKGFSVDRLVTLRVNNLKSNIQEVISELDEHYILYDGVKWYENALIIKNAKEDDIRKLEIYKEGKIYMQSLSSMIPPIILNPNPNENILDMAAAPGGKTTQVAALSQNLSLITACEKNKIRLDRLKYNIDKQGATRVNVLSQDARNLDNFFSFDKILLDAPCSGSGTLSFNNNSFKYFNEELVNRSKKTQLELIKKAILILKKGGELVYSTCSILDYENEKIVSEILKDGNMEIVPIDFKFFEDVPLLPTSIDGVMCVMPTDLYEGFFVAKFIKK